MLRLVGGDNVGRDVGLGTVLPSLLLGHVEALGKKEENLNIQIFMCESKGISHLVVLPVGVVEIEPGNLCEGGVHP